MWFVFPQVAGLGRSAMAQRYAIGSLDEAVAYLAHPLLGARLREIAAVLCELPERSPQAVLGGIDAVKLRSSMTLFEAAAAGEPVFGRVLDRLYGGRRDPETLRIIGR